ncbi:FUSC family protein [Ramlibacter sp. AN1133]|uniref:FUSC family protein n=1 Tax=Ramlibacter sp. AN1133 TaxID=3133429 RepID=UPI0030C23377
MPFKQFLVDEFRQLASVNASDRPWEMPVAAALASGLPIFIGAAFGELGLGLVASVGGLVFLHLPATRLPHRMAWLMACAFGMTGSYAMGLVGHLYPPLLVPLLVIIAIVVTMVCRFYAAPPPGSLFFVMAAAIGAYTPAHGRDALVQVGALALGTVLAVAIAFLYSLHIVSRRGVPAPSAPPDPEFDFVVVDSVVIGAFVGLSLLAAQALQLDRPYWVPVSCLAIIQGASLRAAWSRQLQRIVGTALGLLVFLAIAQLPLDAWGVACVLTVLTLVIETLVVRHYGLATVFITPLTILLAEAAQGPAMAPQRIMQARLVDTIVGATIGLAGAACLHSPRLRAVLGAGLRRMLPGA